MSITRVRAFRRLVYRFFSAHGRDLPWRHTTDPYHVLVSEIMLQQTQVERVAQKFTLFIRTFPTVRALARAPLRRVLAAWQGLGYNRRGLMLHRAARMIVEQHDSVVPRDPAALQNLPGIGPATARSIAAFAWNRPEVFVETNIRSVFIHHFFPGRSAVADSDIEPLVAATLDTKNPYRWYSALMDYGSALKKTHANPSRRSAHHGRQNRFEGSDRQVRGAILRALLDGTARPTGTLAQQARTDSRRVARIARRMAHEGLIKRTGRGFEIA